MQCGDQGSRRPSLSRRNRRRKGEWGMVDDGAAKSLLWHQADEEARGMMWRRKKHRHRKADGLMWIAFWQLMAFAMLILLIWLNEIMDLAALWFGTAPGHPDIFRGSVLTIAAIVGRHRRRRPRVRSAEADHHGTADLLLAMPQDPGGRESLGTGGRLHHGTLAGPDQPRPLPPLLRSNEGRGPGYEPPAPARRAHGVRTGEYGATPAPL